MKNTILFILCFICCTSFAQQATTRAVVIGISDYQEPLIPDLKYAHRDAAAFADWLRSPAGGSLAEENILLHTNEAATNAEMIMSLNWLIEESKQGDKAFIYFSGHGDVERVTKYNNGYLLGYDSPPAVYGAGAFAVNYLKDIIATLSDNGVQVFQITDACRAGKLAGSSVNGTQATAARLSEKFANEIKILSCQPDEFSLEGEQWGGRGCFSYHLENALYGFADQNDDAQINLLELGRYLQDKVSAEAAPESQIPFVEGPPKERIAFVDELAFASRKEMVKNRSTEFLAVSNRGIEEMVFADVDTNIQLVYQNFLSAIDSNFLMEPAGICANDYYNTLIANQEVKKLHGTIKRKFVVALMDEGQQIINRMMQTDRQMLDDISSYRVKFDHLPVYFNRAAEILEKGHYVYNNLKAKELYFKSKSFYSVNYPDESYKSLAKKRRILLEESLDFDTTIVLTYLTFANTFGFASAERIFYLRKALSLAPNWILGNYTLAGAFRSPENYKEGIEYYKKTIGLDSSFINSYNAISGTYGYMGMIDSSTYWRNLFLEKFFEKKSKHPEQIIALEYQNAGNALKDLKKYEKAKEILLIGDQMSGSKLAMIQVNLGLVYTELQEFENAILAYKKMLNLNFSPEISYMAIGRIYHNFLDNPKEAEIYFSKSTVNCSMYKLNYYFDIGNYSKVIQLADTCINLYPKGSVFRLLAAESKRQLQDIEGANQLYQIIIDSCKGYDDRALAYHRLGNIKASYEELSKEAKKNKKPSFHFYCAHVYALTDQKDKAIASLEKAIELGWEPKPLMSLYGSLCDPFLNPIRETDEYKALVKKHFPQYYDIATRVPGKQKTSKE